MKRKDFLSIAAAVLLDRAAFSPALAAPEVTDDDRNYVLATATGALGGSLTLPATAAKPPVVLIIPGSGPIDRDGNAGTDVRTDTYRLLAHSLRDGGIASLRYDKRGVGASAAALASEADLRFEDLASDAAAWVTQLACDGRFEQVAIAGHSEGSLVGMLAAARLPVDAFISLEGIGFPAADVLREQLRPQLASTPALAAASERILAALGQGHISHDVPLELLALYRTSVQPYLISLFRYDPRVEVAKLRCSVTIVQGTADIQVSVANANALAAAQPAAQLVIIDGMSHVLKAAKNESAEQQFTTVYADPALPLDPRAPQAVVNALRVT